jgi:hypothetical protein
MILEDEPHYVSAPQSKSGNNDFETVLFVGGGLLAAYLLYQWYVSQSAASAAPAPAAAATANSGTTSADTYSGSVNYPPSYDPSIDYSGTGQQQYQGPMLDPMFGQGNIMAVQPRYIGEPGGALAYGAWVAHLSPAQKLAFAKLTAAQKQTRYHTYVAAYDRQYGI